MVVAVVPVKQVGIVHDHDVEVQIAVVVKVTKGRPLPSPGVVHAGESADLNECAIAIVPV